MKISLRVHTLLAFRQAPQDLPTELHRMIQLLCLSTKQGMKQDYSRAVAWAGRATAQGNANGQTTLGYLYDMGYGVPKDAVQALALYRFAAAQGKTWAQYRTRAFLIPAANRINP